MDRLIRPKELQEILGISEATLFRRMKDADFPKKVRISKQAIGFKSSEVRAFIEANQEEEPQLEAVR